MLNYNNNYSYSITIYSSWTDSLIQFHTKTEAKLWSGLQTLPERAICWDCLSRLILWRSHLHDKSKQGLKSEGQCSKHLAMHPLWVYVNGWQSKEDRQRGKYYLELQCLFNGISTIPYRVNSDREAPEEGQRLKRWDKNNKEEDIYLNVNNVVSLTFCWIHFSIFLKTFPNK